MTWHMVHFSEIEALRPSLQFLAFAEAYLSSASHLCIGLAQFSEECNYPRGTVVLSLAFHGVELFLKAAILEKVPTEQFSGNVGHDLDHLCKRYANLYPGRKFNFDIPFRSGEVDLVHPDPRLAEELKALIAEHKRSTPADQLFRYPRDIEGNPWEGIYAFEASSFASAIVQVQDDISRIKQWIFRG